MKAKTLTLHLPLVETFERIQDFSMFLELHVDRRRDRAGDPVFRDVRRCFERRLGELPVLVQVCSRRHVALLCLCNDEVL